MFAITLDEEGYIKSVSEEFRTPGSILVYAVPDVSEEKLNCYKYIDNRYIFDAEKWAAIIEQKESAEQTEKTLQEINHLKDMLKNTDYKIIKCYEYKLVKLSMPYDVAALHAERQELRDKINELETILLN